MAGGRPSVAPTRYGGPPGRIAFQGVMAHAPGLPGQQPRPPGGPVIFFLRRFAPLAVLLIAAVSCGDPTSPRPKPNRTPKSPTPES